MLVLRILLGLALCLWIIFLWRRRRFYKLMFQVKGPIGLPLIGIVYKFRSLQDLFNFAVEVGQDYGFPALTWFGPFPVFALADPIDAQDILTSPNCINKAKLYNPIGEILGDGLITVPNPNWAVHRKLLNPAFSPTNLRSFVPIFNDKTKVFLTEFAATYGGEPINILNSILRLTMNMALETTMGLKNDADTKTFKATEDKLFGYYHYLAEQVMNFIIMPWLRLSFVQNILPSLKPYTSIKSGLQLYFTNLIREKCEILSASDARTLTLKTKKEIDADSEQRQKFPFVDLAIEQLRNGKLTPKDVEDHSNHIVAGAFETTATTVAHVLILLAMNPQCQQIAFEELLTLYPDRDDVTVIDDDLQRLVYLEMVINETMRLIPTVPLVGRRTTGDVKLSSGVVLPEGIDVMIDIFDLHRNKEHWGPNALVFNPENFLPDNMRDRHPYAFIPFTKGIRTCIGARYGMIAAKVVVAIILRKYHVSTKGKFEELRYEPAISIRLVDPPFIKLHLREK